MILSWVFVFDSALIKYIQSIVNAGVDIKLLPLIFLLNMRQNQKRATILLIFKFKLRVFLIGEWLLKGDPQERRKERVSDKLAHPL